MNGLQKTRGEIDYIAKETVGQDTNPLWKEERNLRLTASNFGEVCKQRATTDPKKLANRIIHSTFSGCAATKWGKDHENIAKINFENLYSKKVQDCGIFICHEYPFLAASPDGLILNEEAIVEIKCPYKLSKLNISPSEAVESKQLPYLYKKGEEIKLKKCHNYYYQVQGQLAITGKQYCYFVVWSPQGIVYEKVFVLFLIL